MCTYFADGIFARSNSVNVDFKQMPVELVAATGKLFEEFNTLLLKIFLKEAIFDFVARANSVRVQFDEFLLFLFADWFSSQIKIKRKMTYATYIHPSCSRNLERLFVL